MQIFQNELPRKLFNLLSNYYPCFLVHELLLVIKKMNIGGDARNG
jgi:hypothetical protein